MTNLQINKRIAEIHALTRCPTEQAILENGELDYCSDLNAIFAAEGTLDKPTLAVMDWWLDVICSNQSKLVFRATARERAEALLRALDEFKSEQ